MPSLPPEVAERMMAQSVGDAVTVYDLLTLIFGCDRLESALQTPEYDPEVITMIEKLDRIVNKKWADRGITRIQGPYVRLD